MKTLIGHVPCRDDGPLCEAVWKEAETRALQMLERAVVKYGKWCPFKTQRVNDADGHYIRVTMTIDECHAASL